MKKLILTAVAFLLGAGVLTSQAQAKSYSGDTDTDILMMDHKVLELGDKYVAILSSMYQEEATRAGTLGYHSDLQERDVQAQVARKQTLLSLQDALDKINPKTLSPYTKVDYYILKELIGEKLFAIDNESELSKIEPQAKLVEKQSEYAAELAVFNSDKLHAINALALINSVRPDEISFSRTIQESPKNVEIQGTSTSVGKVNEFVESLKSDPKIASAGAKSEVNRGAAKFTIHVQLK